MVSPWHEFDASASRQAGSVREVVAVFEDQEQLQAAIDHLQARSFNRADLMTVADCRTMLREMGHTYVNVRDIEDDAEIPRTIYVSKRSLGDAEGVLIGVAIYVPTVAVAASLAARNAGGLVIAAGALLAALIGGLLGLVFARRLDGVYRRRFREQLAHGGIVLWVSLHSPAQEEAATEILREAGARDVHVHDRPIIVRPIPGWRGPSYNLSFMRYLGM